MSELQFPNYFELGLMNSGAELQLATRVVIGLNKMIGVYKFVVIVFTAEEVFRWKLQMFAKFIFQSVSVKNL